MKEHLFFQGKKVTQLGLGLLGRGLNDALFMLKNGVADLIVTDKKTAEELAPSVEKLKGFSNLTLRLGEHQLEDFEGRDFILKGAGIPLDSPYIAHAREKGIPIEMDSSLCVKLLPEGVITVGVTGTRGKSTATHLIAHILHKALGSRKLGTSQTEIFIGLKHFLSKMFARKTFVPKVFLGGNVRDMATLPLLSEVKAGDYLVLELDSWQLQGFGESKISPHISVFTTFMDDHLNYYGGDREKYFADKANIFKFQNEKDFLIVGEGLIQDSRFKIQEVKSKVKIAKKELIPKDWQPKIIGEHNKLNIACATEACRALGISEENIKEGVESFCGVEGRLQFVREVNGIKIWNDNNATTPEATLAALASFDELRITTRLPASEAADNGGQDYELGIKNLNSKILNHNSQKNVVLLCGGADKGLELDKLIEKINQTCKVVVLFPGTGSKKLTTYHLPLTTPVIEVSNFKEAIEVAISRCELGDSLLFSPAFASFGMFNNEYERNDLFLEMVGGM